MHNVTNQPKIKRVEASRRTPIYPLLVILFVPALATAVSLGAIAVKHGSEIADPVFIRKYALSVFLVMCMYIVVGLVCYRLSRGKLTYDREGLSQKRFGIHRRVRWDEIRLVRYQKRSFHDTGGWSQPILWIYGKSPLAIVVDGYLDNFSGFERTLRNKLSALYGVSYTEIREKGQWGEKRGGLLTWILDAGTLLAAMGFYLAVISGLIYGAHAIMQSTGLQLK